MVEHEIEKLLIFYDEQSHHADKLEDFVDVHTSFKASIAKVEKEVI